jgi:hypothetical protein
MIDDSPTSDGDLMWLESACYRSRENTARPSSFKSVKDIYKR